jgi:PPOX class probable F420-dependent enzyme
MLPNLEGIAAARAERRLTDETEIWITTVRADGQPQASPVGFLWDGTTFLILSRPDSQKIRNLRGNPRVALHLDIGRQGDGEDGGVLTLEGTATLDPSPIGDDEAAAYVDRYQESIRASGLTPDAALAELSAVIRVTPTRTRAY